MSTDYRINHLVRGPAPMGLNLSLPMTRRDALRVSLFSTAGLLFGGAAARGAGENEQPPPIVAPVGESVNAPALKCKAKAVIQIFLWGGMSHVDTWDPKPDAGYEYMGDLRKAIPTTADGIQVG